MDTEVSSINRGLILNISKEVIDAFLKRAMVEAGYTTYFDDEGREQSLFTTQPAGRQSED